MSASDRFPTVLMAIAGLMLAASPYVIDTAPYESTMGLVQRIFYYHFPIAMTMMIAAIVCGIASALFLFRRTERADHVAVAAAEMAVVFGLLVLITGPLWARKSWGVWWVWDARITSTFMMWMVFNAYLLLRRFGGPGSEALAAAWSRARTVSERPGAGVSSITFWFRRWSEQSRSPKATTRPRPSPKICTSTWRARATKRSR